MNSVTMRRPEDVNLVSGGVTRFDGSFVPGDVSVRN